MVTGTYSSTYDTQSVVQNANEPHLTKEFTQQHSPDTDEQLTLETHQFSEHKKPTKSYSTEKNSVASSKFSINTIGIMQI